MIINFERTLTMANQAETIDRTFYDLVHSPDDGGWYAEVFSSKSPSLVFYETGIFPTRQKTIDDVTEHYPTAELLKEF